MLCHFGQLRNGSVATQSFHSSRTVARRATSECVTVLQRIGENEEPASRNEERTMIKHSFAAKLCLNDAQ